MKTMADRIKIAIKDAGLTQRKVAEALSLAETTISSYATGAAEPSAENLYKIASICKRTTDWIISGTESELPENCHETHADYAGNKITLSDEEAAIITYLRDMPEEYRKGNMRAIHLDWAKAKGLL